LVPCYFDDFSTTSIASQRLDSGRKWQTIADANKKQKAKSKQQTTKTKATIPLVHVIRWKTIHEPAARKGSFYIMCFGVLFVWSIVLGLYLSA
jgi:hypothetical protein